MPGGKNANEATNQCCSDCAEERVVADSHCLLPFLLGRNSLAHTVQDAVDSAVGTPKTAISVDTAIYPEFSSHYWVKGSDPTTVRQFLTPEKIKFIEETKPRGTIATNALYLVYFEYGVLGNDQELDSFIDQISRLAANFL